MRVEAGALIALAVTTVLVAVSWQSYALGQRQGRQDDLAHARGGKGLVAARVDLTSQFTQGLWDRM